MNKIVIEQLSDSSDCDTCGSTYADGARVYLNDELIVDHTPHAHCLSMSYYELDDTVVALLEKLGYEVEIKRNY